MATVVDGDPKAPFSITTTPTIVGYLIPNLFYTWFVNAFIFKWIWNNLFEHLYCYCFSTVKWFQLLQFNINNSIQYKSFVCRQLNSYKYSYSSLIGIILRWGFLIWELIFIYCGLFVLILVVFLCCFFFHYLLTMLTWNRRDLTPLSAAPRTPKGDQGWIFLVL